MYVCGITPYDATHMGHAATYLGFDLLNRAWRNAGKQVTFVENVTDIDDPLLERAQKVNVDWRELAERETQLFREDMAALRVLAPDHFVGAVESIPLVQDLVAELDKAAAVYKVDEDYYFRVRRDELFGKVSGFSDEEMRTLFAERGGDPERAGKEDPLDCVVWRSERPDEPSWPSALGQGRPGWHIECTAIALQHLGMNFDVQGGGVDLVFPHHEMCASEAQVARTDEGQFANNYVHAGMVGYDGEKMSKSRGNLVIVSTLRNAEVDPMAIRLALLKHHYRSDWEWFDAEVFDAVDQLALWRKAISLGDGAPSAPVVTAVLEALANDLDAPTAIRAIDGWAAQTLGSDALADNSEAGAGARVSAIVDSALGVAL